MRIRNWSAALLMLAGTITSCAERGALNPEFEPNTQKVMTTDPADAWISELHYDNSGTDQNEAVEISAPAGQDLSGYTLVLYNGSNGGTYGTKSLAGLAETVCGDRKVVVVTHSGIQNGSPDGMALVDAASQVVEFISYEGRLIATNGVAAGMASIDIGVSESAGGLATESLQRSNSGVWSGPAANTFGSCNAAGPVVGPVATVDVTPSQLTMRPGDVELITAVAEDASGIMVADPDLVWSSSEDGVVSVNQWGVVTALAAGVASITATASNDVAGTMDIVVLEPQLPATRIVELNYDPPGTDSGEAIEIEGPAGTDLSGWSIVLYNGSSGAVYKTETLSGTLNGSCDGRGVLVFAIAGIENGTPDGVALVDAAGQLVEFLSYEGDFVAVGGAADGVLSTNIGVVQSSTQTPQRAADGSWALKAPSLGACNPTGSAPGTKSIFFSGRHAGDAPLPVGFEDQLFATYRDGAGNVQPTTFTWSSETPAIASIDADGVMRALAAGTAIVRATAADGTTETYSLPTAVATASTTAAYANHVEFGTPTDADASNDFIVDYAQYRASFNQARGIPNWVSFNLEATHQGTEDRCDCFTFDPNLPPAFDRYTTADYTGAGAFHGFGIDRGHLVRSFDRTAGTLDNANTFYFTNIIPQASDNNQGPWSKLEAALGDSARYAGRELYIIAGASGGTATVKNEGKITIPDYVWKVAVIMPRDQGLADVDSYDDVNVIAVIMPNTVGIRTNSWQQYQTTVDAVEALSGYDVLSLLADEIEIAVEGELATAYELIAALGVNQTSLNAKVDAALQQLALGNETPAVNQLEALLNELNALERSRRISAVPAQALRSVIERVIASIEA